jgi:hypothetical protein
LNGRLSPIGAGVVFEWSTSVNELGLLILPDGASSRDARSIQIFNDYALKYGRSWYEWINGVLRRKVGNGGLYLVTGVTKSTSWCVVAGKNSSSDRTVSLKLKAPPVGVAAASYTWELENTSFCAHSGPYRMPGEESWRDNQTVLFRGCKVVLSSLSKTPKVLSVSKVSGNLSKILKTTSAPFS